MQRQLQHNPKDTKSWSDKRLIQNSSNTQKKEIVMKKTNRATIQTSFESQYNELSKFTRKLSRGKIDMSAVPTELQKLLKPKDQLIMAAVGASELKEQLKTGVNAQSISAAIMLWIWGRHKPIVSMFSARAIKHIMINEGYENNEDLLHFLVTMLTADRIAGMAGFFYVEALSESAITLKNLKESIRQYFNMMTIATNGEIPDFVALKKI